MIGRPNRVFLFGSSGYIGRRLKTFFAEEGFKDVFSVGRSVGDVLADLAYPDFSLLLDTVSKHDVFIFLASVSSPDACTNNFHDSWKLNVVNTRRLIQELIVRDVRVVFASSDVVAVGYKEPANEESKLRPFGAYGHMKAAIELEFENEPNFKAARLSYVISKSDRFSSLLYESVREKEQVQIFHGFNRNVVSCLDVVTGFSRLVENWDIVPSSSICFSGPHLVSRLDIALQFQELFPELKYSVVEPEANFWVARPRTIEVDSMYFEILLGRKRQSVIESLRMEFKNA